MQRIFRLKNSNSLQNAWRVALLNSLTFSIFGLLFWQKAYMPWTTTLLSLGIITVFVCRDTRNSLLQIFTAKNHLHHDWRWITWPFLGWFIAAMLIAWFSSHAFFGIWPRENPLRFSASLALLALTTMVRPSSRWLLWGLLAAVTVITADCIRDWFLSDYPRTQGTIGNAAIFGMWSMVVSMLLVLISVLSIQRSIIWRIGLLMAAMLALFASITSGTRTAIMALLFLGLMLLFLRKDKFHRWLVSLGVACVLIGGGLLLTSSVVQKQLRLSEAKQDLTAATAQNYDTSLGARLVMWHAALQMFQRSPLVGLGPNAYQNELQQMIDSNELPRIFVYTNAHSDILNQLAIGGLLGLLAYLGIIFGPLIFFSRALIRAGADAHQRLYAAAGLLLTMTFFWFGLTNSTMYRPAYHSMTYPLLVCALAAQLLPQASINRKLRADTS